MTKAVGVATKPFGATGVRVPVIGQGTWRMGSSRRERAAEAAALELGLALGMTHIDTAEMYNDAEEVIAEVLRGRPRADLFVTSKVLPENATYKGTIRAAEKSLRRLGLDYLDLYLLHWPGRHSIGETMRAMEDLVAAGKIRFLGVSNFDVDELREAMRGLTKEPMAANQVLYNLTKRGIERDLIPFCAAEGIAVVGYTPFGGFPGPRAAGFEVLADVARRHRRTERQVALGFLTRQANVFAIPKASDLEHVRENAGAALDLTPAEIDAIDQAFPAPKRKVPLATA